MASLWTPKEQLPAHLTPTEVRDVLIDCFTQAQAATFERANKLLYTEYSQDQLRMSVEGVMRMAFKKVGGDYEQPTKAALLQVVNVLSEKARAWKTDSAIIDNHRSQILALIDQIPD